LDYTLIGLLAGMPPLAAAQEAQAPQANPMPGDAPSPAPAECKGTGDECRSDEGLVFRLRTLGERDPATQDGTPASSAALQPDRRATVAMEAPGRATVAGKFNLQL